VVSVRRKRRFFEFRGGVPCLDFVNTLAWRLTDRPVEYLASYEDLLVWGRQAGLLASEEMGMLSKRATADPEEARATLSRAVDLREAVHGALSAAIVGEPPRRRPDGAQPRTNGVAVATARGWGTGGRLRVGLGSRR
jgi:hypothetical protein